MLTTCREVQSLIHLFFDSELEARQMRVVALHSATCPHCEGQLRGLERLQDAVALAVNEQVDEIDLSSLWVGVEKGIGSARASWATRLRLWWEDRPSGMIWNGSLIGAAAVGFAIAIVLMRPAPVPQTVAIAAPPASSEGSVTVDSIDSERNVALLKEADTLVLWLDDDTGEVPVNWDNNPQ